MAYEQYVPKEESTHAFGLLKAEWKPGGTIKMYRSSSRQELHLDVMDRDNSLTAPLFQIEQVSLARDC